jgi:hypothetical protein
LVPSVTWRTLRAASAGETERVITAAAAGAGEAAGDATAEFGLILLENTLADKLIGIVLLFSRKTERCRVPDPRFSIFI